MERYTIPVAHVGPGSTNFVELVFRIVYERSQSLALLFAQRVCEYELYFVPDSARCVVGNMQKRFMLAVYIAHEVFGALGKVAYCLQVYYLRTDSLNRRILPCHQRKIAYGSAVYALLIHMTCASLRELYYNYTTYFLYREPKKRRL